MMPDSGALAIFAFTTRANKSTNGLFSRPVEDDTLFVALADSQLSFFSQQKMENFA